MQSEKKNRPTLALIEFTMFLKKAINHAPNSNILLVMLDIKDTQNKGKKNKNKNKKKKQKKQKKKQKNKKNFMYTSAGNFHAFVI
jgi:prophage tail gpP-like protein